MSEERLPMAGVEPVAGPDPVRVESSSVRLVGTLAGAGALAGLAIVLVNAWANPRIEAWRAEVLAAAVTEVLAGADRYETVYIEEGGLTAAPLGDTVALDRVFVGYDRDATPIGVALVAEGSGFQDVIRVIFGYDPATGEVIGMQVLESKETPGLGDKITKDSSFVAGFLRVMAPILGVKAGRESGADAEVTMITGATISSRAVIEIINTRLAGVAGAVDAYWPGAASTARLSPPQTSTDVDEGVHVLTTATPGGAP